MAFNGAGRAKGDLIDVAGVDGDLTNNPSLIDPFVFGGTGKCHLSVANVGSDTLVRGNVDDDASFEFQILIADGAVRASAYSQFDFILTV